MSELQPGVFLGHYELLVRIGRGGMASVWVARERSAVSGKERYVAVKAMLPELARHSEFRSMFLSEVQIIQSIQHDNVVRVFEVSEDHDVLYMAMEWVEGDSLRNIIRASRARGALPPEIAVCIAADAASGLHAAHELRDWDGQLRGVVHCDVSPHNILVGLEGKAKLVDFGIASAVEQLHRQDSETIQGKVSYMSPEQAMGGQVDRRTDVFALGIVLYEMTLGEQLFRGRDAAHTLELVKRGRIPRPSLLSPSYPKRLEPIVLKALERDPEQRFQSAEEFEFELSSYLTEEHAVVSHPVVARLLWELLGPRIEKRREIIAAISSNLDAHRPTGNSVVERMAWMPDIPQASDPMNFTATGNTLQHLGLAARLEAEGTASISRAALAASVPPPVQAPQKPPWALIAGGVALLALATVGSFAYFSRGGRPSTEQPDAAVSLSDAPSAPAAQVKSTTGNTRTAPEDVVSIDKLPVRDPDDNKPSSGSRRRSAKGEKSFDQLVDEGAAAAAKKGHIAQSNHDEPEQPAAPVKPAAAEKAAPTEGIDRAAAASALAAAAARARNCRGQGPVPSPQGQAMVTFMPSGGVSIVNISQSFVGTPTGTCVISYYKNARVPAFTGEPVTLPSTFQVPE